MHGHSSSRTPAACEAPDPPSNDLRQKKSEEKEQTAKWMAWMEANNRRKKEVKLMQAVEGIPRDPAATSSSGASDHGGNYGGDPAYRGAG